MGGDGPAWQATYQDPIRCQMDGSAQEIMVQGNPQIEEVENELCNVKMVMMHKPSHQPQREKSMEYPFSWHLSSRRRLWEMRIQIRFHLVPRNAMYFGIELDRFVPVSGVARQAQKALVSACQRAVGDCYHTNGDDPSKTNGELEPPAFVMPLWAFDQVHVANPGQEPSLLSDLEGVGMKRSDGAKQYVAAMRSMIGNFSTDKVYTFCFWGVSKFLDIMKWEVVGGLMPGVKLDFNKLCGSPPVFLTIYELPGAGQEKDKRHLASRKRQYFRAAVWSTLKPPGTAAPVEDTSDLSVDYWSGMTGFEGMDDFDAPGSNKPAVAAPVMGDLLDLGDFAPAGGAMPPPAPAQSSESTDLLGLF